MKKSLFFVAAAALALTACTSENDILETGPAKQATPQAVGFDVYTPAATVGTRAGLTGTMTTGRLQRSQADGGGFGVYAYLTEDDVAAAGDGANATAYTGGAPNFMVNEKILWNNTNLGWYYNPLKYWPNETDNDSQTTPATMEGADKHLDRLTFFAYAPYVAADDAGGTGIIRITDNAGELNSTAVTDPTIEWKATTAVATFKPNEGVDLLWGVAPSGGLSYTAVNGSTVTRDEGTPLLNMIKPDVNTSMKFLFQHALARIGVNVVAAIDQVSPGGELDPNTKITINSFKITGPFGTTGKLSLNNGTKANIANWTTVNSTAVVSGTKIIDPLSAITVTANDATPANNAIAENLRWTADGTNPHTDPVAQPVIGVTPAKQDLLIPSDKWFNKKAGAATPYNPGKKYFTDPAGTTEARATYDKTKAFQKDGKWGFAYTVDGSGVYTKLASDIQSPIFPSATSSWYFVKATEYTVTEAANAPTGIPSGAKIYQIDAAANNGSEEAKAPTFEKNAAYSAGTWTGAAVNDKVYTLEATLLSLTEIPFAYSGDIYEAERNYLYVVPTNNFNAVQASPLTDNEAKALRTITVQIEYYITTKDDKLAKGFAETKNVITKEVVLPSLANGKSYMLNLVLGLTSVKIEAEVDDWKVENVQADLPQNTAE